MLNHLNKLSIDKELFTRNCQVTTSCSRCLTWIVLNWLYDLPMLWDLPHLISESLCIVIIGFLIIVQSKKISGYLVSMVDWETRSHNDPTSRRWVCTYKDSDAQDKIFLKYWIYLGKCTYLSSQLSECYIQEFE